MIDVALAALRGAAGLGVAGNFAGHLEQAGEAADFANVVPTAAEAPKGMVQIARYFGSEFLRPELEQPLTLPIRGM